ncbi:translation termination factor GTPase eRF3 [Nowakowskiella sp. JEL0407]|nr:translation termination factor GTPase eRF3 [Nowakowskiella sp. JEL0407]
MSEEQKKGHATPYDASSLEQQTQRMSLNNYNMGAQEFVPSWLQNQNQQQQQWYPPQNMQQQYNPYYQQQYQQPYANQYHQPYYQQQQQNYYAPQQQQYQPQQQAYNPSQSYSSQKPVTANQSVSTPPANSNQTTTPAVRQQQQQQPAVVKSLSTPKPQPPAPTTQKEPTKEKETKEAKEPKEPVKSDPEPTIKPSATSTPTAPKKPAQPTTTFKEPDFSDVKDDGKETVNIIFIGHVDAGKSTMSGHLLYLSGMVDKRTMDKYQQEAKDEGKESWYLSWVMDLNEEERSKGKTVEYGRGYFETDKRRFTILDAPGHKLYVPSMLSGAAQADVGILVLSARKGEFETGFERGGQTREHAMLAKTAGVKKLLCVVNKMDDPTVMWSKERYDEILQKIGPFLKQAGFKEKKDLEYIPVSGFSGDNLKDRLTPEKCSWYSGPSLLELLNNMELAARKVDAPLMMPISDKFKDMGTIVTGKIESGRIRKGQQVLIMPNRKQVEVLTIYIEDQEIENAKSGDNVRIRLKNVEEEDITPGFVLCGGSKPVHTVTAFEAEIGIVEHKSIICAGWNCVLHLHTAVEEITLVSLLHMVDKKTGRKTKHPPKFIKQGDKAIVRIETQGGQICVETFADYEQLGRFTLRDEGRTVAIGKVTKLILEE